jgi:hypothetical protein
MTVSGSKDSIFGLFDLMALEVEAMCDEHDDWTIDGDNFAGVFASRQDLMVCIFLLKSLHDLVFCLQVEANTKEDARIGVVEPLLQPFR